MENLKLKIYIFYLLDKMSRLFFAFIEWMPHLRSRENKWPSCICLNHPVMLSHNHKQASDFIQSVKVKCGDFNCDYCFNDGVHRATINIVTLPFKLEPFLYKHEILGKITVPMLYISYFYLDERKETLEYKWTFDPLDVPLNSIIKYEEPIFTGIPIEIDTWKR